MFKHKLKEIHVLFLCTLTLQPVLHCPHSCAWRGTTNCCTSWRSLMARWCKCDWVLPLWQPPPSPLHLQGPANCQRWVAEQQPVSAWLGLMYGTWASLICSTVLHSRADSLLSRVILHEWQVFYSAFFWISIKVVYLQQSELRWVTSLWYWLMQVTVEPLMKMVFMTINVNYSLFPPSGCKTEVNCNW